MRFIGGSSLNKVDARREPLIKLKIPFWAHSCHSIYCDS
ncbi:hypothetical protein O59_003828 [Cellvibrio sp. BR]|nr:hypothetical protein O59_003828 [Cellvibrio sp. BR]